MEGSQSRRHQHEGGCRQFGFLEDCEWRGEMVELTLIETGR
jgi:hypothetical protein